MKIAAMQKDGKPKLLSDTEKTHEAVKDAFCKDKEAGCRRLVHGVEVAQVTRQGIGNQITYLASGKIKYKLLDEVRSALKPTRFKEFSISFRDALDEYGQPDLQIIQFTCS